MIKTMSRRTEKLNKIKIENNNTSKKMEKE